MTATGYASIYLPQGPERDEIMGLVRIGLAFKRQHRGRRPGFLANHLASLALRIGESVSFERVIDELEIEAARRDLHGEHASPIEKVDRIWEVITYHHPSKGRLQVTFKTVKNKLPNAKKAIIPDPPK